MKIFKYTVLDGYSGKYIVAPKNIQIIRMGFVLDNYNNGSFVWGIVDTNAELVEQRIYYTDTSTTLSKDFQKNKYNNSRIQLRIKEKQDVLLPCNSKIVGVEDEDGKLWLYYNDSRRHINEYKMIVFYKTGQKITEPIDSLEYIGGCRLFIMQELFLYAFLVK